jgi:hypothetical protein
MIGSEVTVGVDASVSARASGVVPAVSVVMATAL